jgi:lipoprotein-anchoring transpeptidase ErfK/SrfK
MEELRRWPPTLRQFVRRTALVISLALVLIAGLAVGALAFADGKGSERIAEGVRVAGIDVGGLTREQALVKLRDRIGTPVRQAARVHVGDRTFKLTAERARVRVALGAAVNRAYAASREGGFIERGWREITGGTIDRDESAPVAIDKRAVRSFVGSVHAAVARKPVDAKLDIQLTSVGVSESKPGRRLAGREDLVQRVAAAMTNPRADRTLRANIAVVKPKVSTGDVWDATPTVVTVARDGKTVRVFKRGEVAQSYRVAVGEPKYPTPTGQFSVQTKQVDPPWNVPNSEWAGELAGKTIPGGDPKNPLVARWIGFNGSVGFHGTKSLDSLGRSASHGCVRMAPGDVIDLYEHVQVGTPVLVA